MSELLGRQTPQSMGCVYVATNRLTGRSYIGKSSLGMAQRRGSHLSKARAGKGFWFGSALNKYGPEAFDWAEAYLSNDDAMLLEAEMLIISYARKSGEALYNLAEGGQGPNGIVRSEETRKRSSEALKGRKLSEAHCRAIGLSRPATLPAWTEERRAKVKAAWTAREGISQSAEERAVRSAAAKRRYERPGEREKAKAAAKLGAAARWGAK